MDVLRNDGLSATRQQQFQTAFQRERQHREDARRRWGEIADDGEDSNQRNTLSSFSEAVRRRRSAIGVRVRPELAGSGASGVRMMEFGSRRRSPSPLRGSRESSDGLSSFTSNANRRLAHYRARARLGQYQHDDPLHSDITHAFPGFRLRHRLSGNIGDYVVSYFFLMCVCCFQNADECLVRV
ncbi:hypothetical protein BD410DRAFT_380755 [Rickenella mellea]|uniref:Uncharacterized protein n=1 Tax=Rickenella mellea TaxID=50990 RepID=A0A4Y7PZ56_9AGAM|nr:hypothetical protein BD410DRAFT_380755 [Rickenella mellea]